MYKSLQDVEQQLKLFEAAFDNYADTNHESVSYITNTPTKEFNSTIYKKLEEEEIKADTNLKLQAIELKQKVRILISEIHITEPETEKQTVS